MQRPRLNHVPSWRRGLQRLRRGQRCVQRLISWAVDSEFKEPKYASSAPPNFLGEVRIPITRTGAHPLLERGKRQNVMLAATALDYLQAGPQHPISFWRAVGPLTAARGFVAGMELHGGCAVPANGKFAFSRPTRDECRRRRGPGNDLGDKSRSQAHAVGLGDECRRRRGGYPMNVFIGQDGANKRMLGARPGLARPLVMNTPVF
jgi:hypothetical protein